MPDLIRLRCPACNALMSCPASKAGSKAPCPQCGQRLEVPRPAPPPTVLAALVPAPPPVQVPVLPPVTFCPHCNCRFRWDHTDVGSRMACPDCQGVFLMPVRPGVGDLATAPVVQAPQQHVRVYVDARAGARQVDPLAVVSLVSGLLAAGLLVVPCGVFMALPLPFALVGLVTGLFSLARRPSGPAVVGLLLALAAGGVSGYWTARFYGAVGRAVDQANESTREHNERVRRLNEW